MAMSKFQTLVVATAAGTLLAGLVGLLGRWLLSKAPKAV
jgi:hypothetical protein